MIKHASATEVIVDVIRSPKAIFISVLDNGRGFKPEITLRNGEKDPGFGLAGILERAKVLGGQVEIQSAPGRGTRLTLSVPLTEERK